MKNLKFTYRDILAVVLAALLLSPFGSQLFSQSTPSGYPTPPGSGEALKFDGSDDYVVLGGFSLPAQYCVESWINLDSPLDGNQTIIGGCSDPNSNCDGLDYRYFQMRVGTGGNLEVGASYSGAGQRRLVMTTSSGVIPTNEWIHVAANVDFVNNTGQLFINGVSQPLTYDIVGEGAQETEISLIIGVLYTFFPIGPGFKQYFNGTIDELRIFNTTLSAAEIQDHMCQKDLSAHPQIESLSAHYRFDDGMGSSQIGDVSVNANNGGLQNIDLDSSWVTSGAPIGDISDQSYSSGSLTFSDGSGFTADILTGNPEGIHIYKVNEPPNDITLPAGYSDLETSEYYGVFLAGGNNPTYTATYNYGGNSNVNGQPNELSARLASRESNASGGFINVTDQSLDVSANTLTANNQSGNEYIIGFADVDCPLIGADIGDPCDDSDSTTENDIIQSDCSCEGTPICANPFPAVDEASLSTTFTGDSYLTAWDAVAGQIGCQVAVRFAGGNLLGQVIVPGTNASFFNIPGGVLSLNTSYEWRVRCGCSQSPIVAGPWSSWQPFTTPGGASITSSPNPTEGISNVSFQVADEGMTTLEVYDSGGRKIAELFSGIAHQGGDYRFEFDGSDLPNGIYLYRLTTANEVKMEKFMIGR